MPAKRDGVKRAPRSIPESLNDEVLRLAGDNKSTRWIARWLGESHKVATTHKAVARLLNELREGRREVAQAVVAEKLSGHVTADLDVLGEQQRRLSDIAGRLYAKLTGPMGLEGEDPLMLTIGNTPMAAVHRGVEAELRAVTERKLELSGAGGEQQGGPKSPGIYVPPESSE